jgi:manganese/zinc/iron transport system ATP- binding protein
MQMNSILDIHDVTVAYHRRPVIWDVDLTLHEPRLAAIVGPNGAGQSTLIKAVLGLVPMASGRVEIFGQPVARVRQRIGYVPQRESVDWDFPVSVLDVVLMGTYGQLGWIRRPGRAERDWARECLGKVGLLSPLRPTPIRRRAAWPDCRRGRCCRPCRR